MNKKEMIDKYEYLNHDCFRRVDTSEVLRDLKQLNEPQKVEVLQIVADYIKYTKENDWDLLEAMDNIAYEDDEDLRKWFNNNMGTFARAWLDGYTVEKEKRYRVKMKNAYYNKHPQFLCETDNGIFWAAEIDLRKTKFTRKELEQAGFEWVFDCEGIEIEEVE